MDQSGFRRYSSSTSGRRRLEALHDRPRPIRQPRGHGAARRVPDHPAPATTPGRCYRFEGRISADGSTPFAAEAGRYHIYSGWFCPWAQRVTIVHELAGLQDVVSLSYVDGKRDARGWAFREANGPDPVNGFTLLRQAYDATEPGFDGHVSVPTLWDRTTGTVASNQFKTIGIDLATQFRAFATPSIDTYPAALADRHRGARRLDRTGGQQGRQRRRARAPAGRAARAALLDAFAELDRRLAGDRFLLGEQRHRGRHPAVRHAGALRCRGQRRPGDQPRPRHLPEPVGLRP